MAGETDVVPDLYFPGDKGELQDSSTGDGEAPWQVEGLEGGDAVDLTQEGFIPIHKLTLEDLPESIRTQGNLQLILDFAKRVVRINNNNKISDQRPDDDEFKMRGQKSLTGSGFIWSCTDESVTIITNRHVLFNAEEVHKSTFDIFFDVGPRDYKRCRRLDGKYLFGKCSKYDLVLAEYQPKPEMISHIQTHWSGHTSMPRQWQCTQRHAPSHGASMAPVVCLISHPLGQPKQVSFGEMVAFSVHKKILHYDAPSKPGSSGAPLLVFTNYEASIEDFVYIYHVGTGLKSGRRVAHVDYADLSLLDREDTIAKVLKEESAKISDEYETDEMARMARNSFEGIVLAAYIPIFGAYHLQFQETRLFDMDPSLVKPCKDFQKSEVSAAILRHPEVKEIACSIAQTVPCFALPLSSDPKDVSDLVSVLESQGPCFCRSIVKMMERGVRPETSTATADCLSPSRAATTMSTDDDVTWPWLNGSNTSCSSESQDEKCLLMKCLKMCALTIPVALLHMIVKANASIRELLPQYCEASLTTSGDEDDKSQVLYSRQEQREDQQPGDARPSASPGREGRLEPENSSSDENWLLLAKDVLLLCEEAVRLNLLNFAAQHFSSSDGKSPRQEGECSELSQLFSRCLARSEHMVRHERQVHPDRENTGQGQNCKKCHCSRPVISEALNALHFLKGYVAQEVFGGDYKDFAPIEEIATGSQEDMDFDFSGFFLLFLNQTEESGQKGDAMLAYLDEVGHFPKGRHSVLLYLAAIESLLYNCLLVTMAISHDILPHYFASPASMFGRPGSWPGNVTPPEVRDTAWRLVVDAMAASGLPPALLADLRTNKERREKLVDVYVDMKQLKWQGHILPEEFPEWLSECRKRRISHFEDLCFFPNATAYFVVRLYFTLFPEVFSF